LKQKANKQSQEVEEEIEYLTKEQIDQRIAELEELEYQKKQDEKKFEKLIRQVETKITQVEHDKNIWAIKLKEKEQEFRLNELRIKELKRQVPHKALKPLSNKENSKNQKKRQQKPIDPRANMRRNLKNSPVKSNSKKNNTKDLNEEEKQLRDEDEPEKPKKTDKEEDKNPFSKTKPQKVDQEIDNDKNPFTKTKPTEAANQIRQKDAKLATLQNEKDSKGLNDENSLKSKEKNSRLSGDKGEDFYDNSFSEDNDEKMEVAAKSKPKDSSAKTKPFQVTKRASQDNNQRNSQMSQEK
jgi:colicin import membrane protein